MYNWSITATQNRTDKMNDTTNKTLPALTAKEKLALLALADAADAATGGEFGFCDEVQFGEIEEIANDKAMAALCGSLQRKGFVDLDGDVMVNGKRLGTSQFYLSDEAKEFVRVVRAGILPEATSDDSDNAIPTTIVFRTLGRLEARASEAKEIAEAITKLARRLQEIAKLSVSQEEGTGLCDHDDDEVKYTAREALRTLTEYSELYVPASLRR